jgi:hypothetical protein
MPPRRGGVASIANRSTRSGQPTAMASAVLEPQSWPATMNRSTPSPSISAIMSIARMALLPVRGAPSCRRVSPKPRRVGTIVRRPAWLRAAATWFHVDASSGQPWISRTTGPSRGPVSAKAMSSRSVERWGIVHSADGRTRQRVPNGSIRAGEAPVYIFISIAMWLCTTGTTLPAAALSAGAVPSIAYAFWTFSA